ncbi:hypothetical protein FPV67DRAFT_2112 [Lyophyllum atratum]|nr:hypothetical protein FPV67DRAFT_2112 [Lyophyllum atratum]
MAEGGPRSGHLGTTWEIAVVIVFIVLIIVTVSTVVVQIRRKQRRRRQEALDAELGHRSRVSYGEKGEMDGATLSIPERAAYPARHSKSSRSRTPTPTSSYHDHDRPSKKPPAPRYYWDYR